MLSVWGYHRQEAVVNNSKMRGYYFILFKSAVELINTKKHITIEGLIEIVSIRAAINLGLTETLIASFPYISPKYWAQK